MTQRLPVFRILLVCVVLGTMTVFFTSCACAQENIFRNSSFEELDDDGNPVHWRSIDFNTGGEALLRTGDAQDGNNYVALSAESDDQRACWRQRFLWDKSDERITVGGWYRTKDVKAASGKGASIRVLFNDDPDVWHHLDIMTGWYDPVEEWTFAKSTFPVPEGTQEIIVEFFHWWTPGETHWDNVFIRPATEEEKLANILPPNEAVDREPVHGRNLPYSPADGSETTLNPPPFLWLPSGNEATYELQIDTTPDFDSNNLIAFEEMEWCFQMLTQTLEPGIWYWRYGVNKEDYPTIWSKTREFVVTSGADEWVYPGIDSINVPQERPRLFVTADELPEIRRRAAEGDLKDMADRIVKGAKNHIGEELVDEPDFLPKDPKKRGPAYTLTFRETRPPMNVMEQAALAYLLTGDEECGNEAKRRLLHFFSWDPQGSTGYFHNDEPAMWVMMRGTRAYDWTYDLFTEEERKIVEESMRIRAADMYKMLRRMPFENNPYSSHPGRTIGFLGESAIEFFGEWPEAEKYLEYISKIYWGVYPAWGKEDGGWNEGPGYWGAYMSFGMHFVVAFSEATGVPIYERPFWQNTPYYRLYITPPHTSMAPFGDGTQWTPSKPGTLMYWFSSLNQDPVIRWYAEQVNAGPGSSILSVVLKDDDLPAEPPADLPEARLFDGVGLVSIHTDLASGANDVHFAMRASPYGAVSHGHNDQNCFVLEGYGEALAIATGYYNRYGSPHHAGWTRQTKAKCGITIDGGIGQDRGWHATGEITDFVHDDAFDLFVGDATDAYGGRLSSAIRQVFHVRPGIFVIRDVLASDEPRTWEYWLHAIDEMDVEADEKTVIIDRDNATCTVSFLAPDDLEFTQTNEYDPHPAWPPDREWTKTWHFTAATAEKSTENEFVTVLLPARAGEEDQNPQTRLLTSDTARGAELTFADGSKTVVGFGVTGADEVTLENISTDARFFAVTYAPDDSVRNHLLHDGTRLQADGEVLK